jgi:hypothetical protein
LFQHFGVSATIPSKEEDYQKNRVNIQFYKQGRIKLFSSDYRCGYYIPVVLMLVRLNGVAMLDTLSVSTRNFALIGSFVYATIGAYDAFLPLSFWYRIMPASLFP